MRDPKRIDTVLQQISNIWHKYPDMRLGQLIGNVLEGASLYYVEDDGLVTALKDMYEGAKDPVSYDNDAYIFDLVKKYPYEVGFVTDSETYEDYLKTYETVSENPTEDAVLKPNEFNALKSIFPTPKDEEEKLEEELEDKYNFDKFDKDQFLKKDFVFVGDFRPECEGESKDGGLVTDPQKAIDYLRSNPDNIKHVSIYRDGGSYCVTTNDGTSYFFRVKNASGKYYPYAIKSKEE